MLRLKTLQTLRYASGPAVLESGGKGGIKRNRFMDNQYFDKYLNQDDCFNLKEKIDWRDVRTYLSFTDF